MALHFALYITFFYNTFFIYSSHLKLFLFIYITLLQTYFYLVFYLSPLSLKAHKLSSTDTQKRQQTNYFCNCITSKTFTFSCLIQSVCFLSFSLSQTEAVLPLFASIFILYIGFFTLLTNSSSISLLNCIVCVCVCVCVQPQRFYALPFLLCAPFYTLLFLLFYCNFRINWANLNKCFSIINIYFISL